MLKKIKIVEHNLEWKQIFNDSVNELKESLGKNLKKAYHVGSTSIYGLLAKPCIDIICVVNNLKLVTKPLTNINYMAKGEFNLPLRLFFSKKQPNINLHIMLENCGEIRWNLEFCEYLRKNNMAKAKYAKIKQKLIKENNDGFVCKQNWFSDYTIKKGEIIREIMKEAKFDGYRFVIASNYYEINEYKALLKINKILDAESIRNFCLYKGVDIVAAAEVELSNKTATINKISFKKLENKKQILEKITEWLIFYDFNLHDK